MLPNCKGVETLTVFHQRIRHNQEVQRISLFHNSLPIKVVSFFIRRSRFSTTKQFSNTVSNVSKANYINTESIYHFCGRWIFYFSISIEIDGNIHTSFIKESCEFMKGILNNDEINNITIQDIAEYAKLNNVDVAELSNEESERIMNEIKLNKKQKAIRKFVNEHHITTEGKPRKIYAPSSENGLWYTQDPNNQKNKIRGKNEDIIYQKLYEIYADASQYTIEAWYKIGVDYRKRKSNPRQSTFDRHERTKKTYFTEEFLSMDIRDITSSYIWNYIRDAQEEHQMSLSEVKQLKGTLNLVFEAASDPEIGCRDYNPITTINPMGLFKNNARILGHSTVVNLEKYTVIADNWIENTIQKTQVS